MIASLSGRVTHLDENSLTLEISGVGFKVSVPKPLLQDAHVGQILSLHTYLVVRENELSLYGFPSLESRNLFVLLLGVDRVGPRLALALLSNLTPAALRAAVVNGHSAVISKVPGVGSKTAQKILLHLADRVLPAEGDELALQRQTSDGDGNDANRSTTGEGRRASPQGRSGRGKQDAGRHATGRARQSRPAHAPRRRCADQEMAGCGSLLCRSPRRSGSGRQRCLVLQGEGGNGVWP